MENGLVLFAADEFSLLTLSLLQLQQSFLSEFTVASSQQSEGADVEYCY